ncbi:hypothetical protein GCM10023116_48040 [Kistimonas scapharcae]|uniref:Uncharacterized protein n=1 Tax=Kistimonas scapharcae TaxID=1036133 RepID=A0ABP8VBY1_9GAMM
MIYNREKARLPSTLSVEAFADRIREMNTLDIPKEERIRAFSAHLHRVMADHLTDRQTATELYAAYLARKQAE